jgi:hypothetical protein
MARTLEQQLQWLADSFGEYLQAQQSTAVVTRDFRNHSELARSDLTPGRWTLVASGGSGFDQSTDLDMALNEGRHGVALIFQCLEPEANTPAQVEQRVNAAFEHLRGWLMLGSCNLYLASYDRCRQFDHPYGWFAASLYFTE